MPIEGVIKTLYSNPEKTTPVFPTTKVKAISDEDGKRLDKILEDKYATKNFVRTEITNAQIGGGDEDVNLDGYATEDYVDDAIKKIDFPVDSVNGQTGAIQLTASEVGAAPAGYGLGTETVRRVTIAELDSLTSNGWYLVNNNKTGLTLNNEPFNWAICRVFGANDQWNVKQELFPIGVNNLKIIRSKASETTWYPWECDNPTMTPGLEYRTTERFNGKVVYTRLVECGNLPSMGMKLVDIGRVDITGINHIISCQVMAEVPGIEPHDLATLPTYEGSGTFIANGSFAARTIDGERHHVIVLNAAYDWSMYKGYAIIRYLKDY